MISNIIAKQRHCLNYKENIKFPQMPNSVNNIDIYQKACY